MLRTAMTKLCLYRMPVLSNMVNDVLNGQVCDATGDDKNYPSR